MTLFEVLEEAKKLSLGERKELVKLLVDTLDNDLIDHEQESNEDQHWGRNFNKLMDEIGPIEMKYPEIEDPVEWVQRLRADSMRERLGDLYGDDWNPEG